MANPEVGGALRCFFRLSVEGQVAGLSTAWYRVDRATPKPLGTGLASP